MKRPKKIVAKVRSSRDGRKFHTIKVGRDGRLYCSCAHWRFRCASVGAVCKHIAKYVASLPLRRMAKATIRERLAS